MSGSKRNQKTKKQQKPCPYSGVHDFKLLGEAFFAGDFTKWYWCSKCGTINEYYHAIGIEPKYQRSYIPASAKEKH